MVLKQHGSKILQSQEKMKMKRNDFAAADTSRWVVFVVGGGEGVVVFSKLVYRKLCPKVHTLTLLYTMFNRKRYLFHIPSGRLSLNFIKYLDESVQDILKGPLIPLSTVFPVLFYTLTHEIPTLLFTSN